MYGHDLIEDLNNSELPIIKINRYELTDSVIRSKMFFMGNPSELIALTAGGNFLTKSPKDKGDTLREMVFNNFNDDFKIPYQECTFFFYKKIEGITNKDAVTVCQRDDNSLIVYWFSKTTGQQWIVWPCVALIDPLKKNIRQQMLSGFKETFPEKDRNELNGMTKSGTRELILLVCSSVMLLNTKNIVTIDNPPPAKLNKKRIKNGKQPLFTYKTLRLQLPAKKRRKGSGPATATDNTTRLHLCRGHFKTYTEDKPLLGKFTGRYWWQPHARGDKTKGVVMKDYEVKI